MQAVIRAASGISDEQSRKTSPVQSRRWSSCVKAWLAAGNIARQKARLKMILKFRTFNRSTRIVAPKSRPTLRPFAKAGRRLGINHDRIETRADTSSLLNNCAPEFSIGGLHLRFAVPRWNLRGGLIRWMDHFRSRHFHTWRDVRLESRSALPDGRGLSAGGLSGNKLRLRFLRSPL